MTQTDCDQLAAWLETLDASQLNLLWRWITAAWIARARKELGHEW